METSNNLKVIGLALHNYHDAKGHLPPFAICDEKTGKPLLSWRVALLPYLGEQGLFEQFHVDEPWDSAHNRQLVDRMPSIYADPKRIFVNSDDGKTRLLALVGNAGQKVHPAFVDDPNFRLALKDIADGPSNTILVVEAAHKVPWTKPEDITFAADVPLPLLGYSWGSEAAMVLFADGSVQDLFINSMPEPDRRALITINGGELVQR